MLPLVAIGGVIGAIVSVAKGASWLSDQINGTKNSGSAGGKAGPTALSDAQASSFAATLAAQTAGQSVPASAPVATASIPVVPHVNATDYSTLDRVKAGVVAYSHIGEHHGNQAGAVKQAAPDDTTTVTQS